MMHAFNGITTLDDVLDIESTGIPDLPASTYDLIRQSVGRNPQAKALSFFLQTSDHAHPEVWTYQSLLRHIHQTANYFHRIGARKDTVIAYILPNLPETHFVIWGGQATGIVFAVNPLLEPAAMAELLNAAGATILVTLAPFPGTDLFSKVQQMLPLITGLEHLLLVNLCDRVRGVKKLPAELLQHWGNWRQWGLGGIRSTIPRHIRLHDFNRAISGETGDRLTSDRVISPSDYSSFFCTGGTTGIPKIAMRTHGNEVANAWSAARFLGNGIDSNKNIFCGLPLFHVNAVLVTGLVPFAKGAHVLLGTPQGYRGEGVVSRFWELVEQHRIHFFSGVPTLYASLLQIPITGRNIRSLEYGLCGAAPMPVEIFRRFQQVTGLKILEGYGLTEGTCVSSVNPPQGDRRLGSIGLRMPGQHMKAVLLDQQQHYIRDCDVNEVGVIIISGPNVFSGYRIAEQNTSLWVDTGDGRKWLNTGDLGRQDAEGYFWLTGRRKELIIRGGHNIDPASIEEPLHQHPAVQLAAAVGRPDPHAGELPVAYVQLKEGASTTSDELLAFAASRIAERAAIPKMIHIEECIPLTAVGKIFKPALKHREIRSALEETLDSVGINGVTLDVREDKNAGTIVNVTVSDIVHMEQAKRLLGHFPFTIHMDVRTS